MFSKPEITLSFSRTILPFPREEPRGFRAGGRVAVSPPDVCSPIARRRYSAGKLCHLGPCPPGLLSGTAPPGSPPQPLPRFHLEAAPALGCPWVHMVLRSAWKTEQRQLSLCSLPCSPKSPHPPLGTEGLRPAGVAVCFEGGLLNWVGEEYQQAASEVRVCHQAACLHGL